MKLAEIKDTPDLHTSRKMLKRKKLTNFQLKYSELRRPTFPTLER